LGRQNATNSIVWADIASYKFGVFGNTLQYTLSHHPSVVHDNLKKYLVKEFGMQIHKASGPNVNVVVTKVDNGKKIRFQKNEVDLLRGRPIIQLIQKICHET
jgi:hypothetical protein